MTTVQTNGAERPYPPVYKYLMTIGLLGCTYRLKDDVATVCAAVEKTLLDPTEFRRLRAIAQSAGGDASFASESIQKHLEENPDDDSAKIVLSGSLAMAGDPEWRALADYVLATSTDLDARDAATKLVNTIDQYGLPRRSY